MKLHLPAKEVPISRSPVSLLHTKLWSEQAEKIFINSSIHERPWIGSFIGEGNPSAQVQHNQQQCKLPYTPPPMCLRPELEGEMTGLVTLLVHAVIGF